MKSDYSHRTHWYNFSCWLSDSKKTRPSWPPGKRLIFKLGRSDDGNWSKTMKSHHQDWNQWSLCSCWITTISSADCLIQWRQVHLDLTWNSLISKLGQSDDLYWRKTKESDHLDWNKRSHCSCWLSDSYKTSQPWPYWNQVDHSTWIIRWLILQHNS